MVATTRRSASADNHANWSAIFGAASKKPDFTDDISTYMDIPTHQDITTVYNIYKDFGVGAGFLVRSPSTIVHVHDPFLIGASRKHPSTQPGWLAFADMQKPTDVFQLDRMAGMIMPTKLNVPKLPTLLGLTAVSAIPLPSDISDSYEECEIPNIASLPPFLAELASLHLTDPSTLLIKFVASIKEADLAHSTETGTPPEKPLQLECKALLQWIWAVATKTLPPTDNEVTILTEPEFADRAKCHFKTLLPMPPQPPTDPTPPNSPDEVARAAAAAAEAASAAASTGAATDAGAAATTTTPGALGAAATAVTPETSPTNQMAMMLQLMQSQMASLAANMAATPNKSDKDDFMKKWTSTSSPFDKCSRTVQLLLQLEDPDSDNEIPVEPPAAYKQFLATSNEKGRLNIVRNYFKRKKATLTVTSALVSCLGEPTLQWMLTDTPSRFSLFACAPHRETLTEGNSADLSLAKKTQRMCSEADLKKLTQLRYTADTSCKHKLAAQIYNWRVGLEFRYGENSFVCKDVAENEALLKDETDSFRAFRENVPQGALSFLYRLDFNFNKLQENLINLCSKSNDEDPDMDEVNMRGLRAYLDPTTSGVFRSLIDRTQTTPLINMPPMVIQQYSPKSDKESNKRGAEKGEHGDDNGRAKKKKQVGERVYNDKINATIKNFHYEKKGLIFDALKAGSGPKMGQSHLCGKFHVRGWCTDDCERKSTHRTLPPDLEKQFNKFCQEAATP